MKRGTRCPSSAYVGLRRSLLLAELRPSSAYWPPGRATPEELLGREVMALLTDICVNSDSLLVLDQLSQLIRLLCARAEEDADYDEYEDDAEDDEDGDDDET